MPDLFDVIDATWPAAEMRQVGPWIIRKGEGGGSRVSATTAAGPFVPSDIALAEAAMSDLGQQRLFMVRGTDDPLDDALEAAGYLIKDPVIVYAIEADALTGPVPPVTAFPVWPPLTAQTDIWADGGIGAARLAIMTRAKTPKTTFLGRVQDTPAATMFVGLSAGCAMIHALEVLAPFRKQGLGRHLTRAAANWAVRQGATTLALLTTRDNTAANALYTSLGLQGVEQYHYRIKS